MGGCGTRRGQVIGCQRGDPQAMAELDRLVRNNLDPEELQDVSALSLQL